MILSILFAVLGYRKAEATGRNKILWAILMVVIFIGVQVIAGIFVGVVLGFGVFTLGWSESSFKE
jgi:flagellar basal body-associated protein FliL